MGHLGGSTSVEIDAPLEVVWAVVQDMMAALERQGGLDKMTGRSLARGARPRECPRWRARLVCAARRTSRVPCRSGRRPPA